LFPDTARAQAAGPQDRALGLQEALAKALEHNKELAAFEYRLKEQEGRLEQAGLVPNPELRLILEDAAGSGIYKGFDSAQTTLSLEWVLERRIRKRRVGAAEARSGLLVWDAEILRLDVAAETAQRFLSSLANQARLEAADEAVSLADDTVVAVRRRVRAGKAPSAELPRAEAELATTTLARDDVTHELSISYHRLAAQWGEIEPGFPRVGGELLALPRTESFATLTGRIEQNPQLVRFASEARVAKANLRLAEARRWPTLQPTLGVRRYEATDDTALVAELKIPLPLFSRNQGQVSESRAALARTRADADVARVRVRTTLFELYEELQHHFHRAETLRDEVLPRLTKALEETRRGYEQGRYSYFEWRSVRADLLEAKTALVEASTGAHRLVIAIERLTGERVARP
jgi:cobalt-zinc-cadmium efflux system outer membrane protein